MKNWLLVCFILLSFLGRCFAPPISGGLKRADGKQSNATILTDTQEQDVEYYRYVTQIFNELHQDPKLSRALANITAEDLKPGGIIDHLDLVGHKVRDRLDEIKRMEVEYQHELIRQQKMHMSKREGNEWNPVHHTNTDTFEKEDLAKLLTKHREMRGETDKRRRQKFKEYEMEKEHVRRQGLKHMNASQKEEYMQKEKTNKKGKEHEKIHEPGSKAQLEETWERDDHLDRDSFDEKTLFNLHDKNGDGYLDLYEVETLFLSEVDKVYKEDDPETDGREREEEFQRMSDHMMENMDTDQDGMVSLEEFMIHRDKPDYEKDNEWKPIIEEDQFTSEEYEEYEKAHEGDEYQDPEHQRGPPPDAHEDHRKENPDGTK